jgi:hypothetical protein
MKFVIKEGLDDSSAEYYRGVTIGEAISAIPNGLQPSAKTEQMPIDPTIVEYAIGDEYFDMQEEEIEDWIKNTVPWYDGSVESVSNGVNVTSDFNSALDYAGEEGVVLGISPLGDYVDFDDIHAYIKNANETKIIFVYYQDSFYEPKEFLKRMSK